MKYRNKNQRKSWFFKKINKIDRLSNQIDQEKKRERYKLLIPGLSGVLSVQILQILKGQ